MSERFYSQMRIISSSFSSYNVSPENLCNVNLSGAPGELTAVLEAKIMNIQGGELIKVVSSPFTLKSGVYNTSQLNIKILSTQFQSSAVSEYVKLYHQLPSGKYNYVVILKASDGSTDELSEEIESEASSFLALVTPSDRDTIESLNPLLVWTHRESFNLNQQGEYYRLMIAEIKTDQSAEAALSVNSPLFQLNFLTRHDILYPLDAPKLLPGAKYAWQVQKVINGVITNKTEAWEFVIERKNVSANVNFVEITQKVNTTPYTVQDDKIFFMFQEEYFSGDNKLVVEIQNTKGSIVSIPNSSSLQGKKNSLRKMESSRYELDLNDLGLKSGYYTLKVMNEKNQVYLLNFFYNNL